MFLKFGALPEPELNTVLFSGKIVTSIWAMYNRHHAVVPHMVLVKVKWYSFIKLLLPGIGVLLPATNSIRVRPMRSTEHVFVKNMMTLGNDDSVEKCQRLGSELMYMASNFSHVTYE